MDAVMSLSRLELSRFDLISRLNLLEMNKRMSFIEHVCTALYSNRAFFHQCNEIIAELEPSMQSMLVPYYCAPKHDAHTAVPYHRIPEQTTIPQRGADHQLPLLLLRIY